MSVLPLSLWVGVLVGWAVWALAHRGGLRGWELVVPVAVSVFGGWMLAAGVYVVWRTS